MMNRERIVLSLCFFVGAGFSPAWSDGDTTILVMSASDGYSN